MDKAIILAGAILYLVIAFIVHLWLRYIVISSLDYAVPEDREILNDHKTLIAATTIVSLFWIIYIPYLVISSYIENNKQKHMF